MVAMEIFVVSYTFTFVFCFIDLFYY